MAKRGSFGCNTQIFLFLLQCVCLALCFEECMKRAQRGNFYPSLSSKFTFPVKKHSFTYKSTASIKHLQHILEKIPDYPLSYLKIALTSPRHHGEVNVEMTCWMISKELSNQAHNWRQILTTTVAYHFPIILKISVNGCTEKEYSSTCCSKQYCRKNSIIKFHVTF